MGTEKVEQDKMKLDWPKPPPPGAGATIGERVEYSLAEGTRRLLSLFDEPIAEVLAWGLKLIIKVVEKSTATYMRPVLDSAITKMDPGDPFRIMLQQLRDPTGEGGLALLAGIGSSAGAAGLMSVFEPAFERWRQNAYLGDPTKLPDPVTLLSLYARGHLSSAQLDEWFQRQGYRKEYAQPIFDVLRLRADASDMGALTQRGEMSTEAFKSELQKRGMTRDDAEGLEKLLHIIPGPGDLIRMAVREAFSPEIVSKWQLLSDFPGEFAEWAEKIGLDTEWAQRYWSAHWELPSVQMGFEMLHRDVIKAEELDDLLRVADVMPWWRDKITAISYRPYTRVDTRRMYELGILDRDAIKRAYLDQGYDEEHAENMTEFTVRYSQDGEREATRTDIINSYIEGVITRDEAGAYLGMIGYVDPWLATYLIKADYTIEQRERKAAEEELEGEITEAREETKSDLTGAYKDSVYTREEAKAGLMEIDYPESIAEVFLTRIDFQKAQQLAREEIQTTKELYVNRAIDESGVHQRLGPLNLPSQQTDSLLELWGIQRARRTARPSKDDLLTFFGQGIIDESRLSEELKGHGYSDEYVGWYIDQQKGTE